MSVSDWAESRDVRDRSAPAEIPPQRLAELTESDLYSRLVTSPQGLEAQEASRRLLQYGPNELAQAARVPLALRLAANFYHTFALLLWAGAVLAFLAGLPQLGWAIIGVILINGLFSFRQEYQAERATEALGRLLPAKAHVLRDGRRQEIEAGELVPGDLLLLAEGDMISADARLFEAWELRVNNSALTGESEPQLRLADPTPAAERRPFELPNLVFAGTSVTHGSGRGLVYATGMRTEFGRIAHLTQAVGPELSPLQREVNRVAKIIAVMALVMGAGLFLVGLSLAGLPLSLAFIFAIGMIVANVPEGLLPTVTLALAAAVRRMAQKHALVKRLSSVETLGSATIICTDKTGTLTENQMTVRRLWLAGADFEVTGSGYDPRGEVRLDHRPGLPPDLTSLAGRIAVMCNNAQLLAPGPERSRWDILGDPTEGALLVAAAKLGSDRAASEADEPRVYELPFDSNRKRMSTIHRTGQGICAYVKGAPAEVLDLCASVVGPAGPSPLDAGRRHEILEANDTYARAGLRVLALAYRILPQAKDHYHTEEVECDLTFVALMAMLDPPRPEVARAISDARSAGIKIILITGDYGLTAESIARRIGLVAGPNPRIVNGQELDRLGDPELEELLGREEVLFARVAPEQKMRIAARLQEMGNIVAMTGDGVNDAPALKRADIGVAMGLSGTDVAREASDMVLTDDNFASIVAAVQEGRVVYDNIRKFVVYIFAHLMPEVFPFAAMALSGGAIPLGLTVMQILAIDLGTETLPALALGVERPEPGVMSRPPKKRRTIIDRELLIRSWLFLGVIEGVLVMGAFLWVLLSGGWTYGAPDIADPASPLHPLYLEATTMTFLAVVGTQVGTVFAARTQRESIRSVGLFSNRLILWGIAFELMLTAVMLYVPPIREFFGMAPLSATHWLVALSFAPVIVLADEARKYYRRSRGKE